MRRGNLLNISTTFNKDFILKESLTKKSLYYILMLIESYTKFINSFIEKILSESDILLSSKFIDGRDNSRGDE